MRNLHEFYYKDYFSLKDVPIDNVNRHLDYELLLDDAKKNQLEEHIRTLEGQKRNAQDHQKKEIDIRIAEKKAQIAVNVNVVKYRNKLLTAGNYSKKDEFGKRSRELLEGAVITNDASPDDSKNRFSLDVSYPGLVTGVGIDHEAKISGEFKLGVHFDWTHGMPIVYGSSVKGVLRSYFKEFYNQTVGQPNAEDAFKDIFDGGEKSIYDRDIFFDAVITHTDSKGRILCSDSITPHGDNPLKNPIPITFLKIAPGCTLEFRFKLVDTKIGDKVLKKEDKIKLFKEILTTVGIGAKTNVGYGQLKSGQE